MQLHKLANLRNFSFLQVMLRNQQKLIIYVILDVREEMFQKLRYISNTYCWNKRRPSCQLCVLSQKLVKVTQIQNNFSNWIFWLCQAHTSFIPRVVFCMYKIKLIPIKSCNNFCQLYSFCWSVFWLRLLLFGSFSYMPLYLQSLKLAELIQLRFAMYTKNMILTVNYLDTGRNISWPKNGKRNCIDCRYIPSFMFSS